MGADKKSGLVTIYRAVSYNEANIIRGLLEANGIKSMSAGNAAPSVHMFTIDGMGEVEVRVAEQDAEAAVRIINETEDEEESAPD